MGQPEIIWGEIGLEWVNSEILSEHLRREAGFELRSWFGTGGNYETAGSQGQQWLEEGKLLWKRAKEGQGRISLTDRADQAE